MKFHANNEFTQGLQTAKHYLLHRLSPEQRVEGEEELKRIIDQCGPVIDRYPFWHPLVRAKDLNSHSDLWEQKKYKTLELIQRSLRFPDIKDLIGDPNQIEAYKGIDHTIFFTHGFITCPYHGSEELSEKINKLSVPYGHLSAKVLDFALYSPGVKPVLVNMDWDFLLEEGDFDSLNGRGYKIRHLIPEKEAVGIMLESILPTWTSATVSESWDDMRSFFLGEPSGLRSSFFFRGSTITAFKNIYLNIQKSGLL